LVDTRLRSLLCVLGSILLLPLASWSFDSALSDTAVREAYFIGQRHDESFADLMSKYVKPLPEPKSGPNIHSVAFYTPFALMVLHSSEQTYGYSAQQAVLDHKALGDAVKVVVDILVSDSYQRDIALPSSGPNNRSSVGFIPPPLDFWKTIKVEVTSGDQPVPALSSLGQPQFSCSEYTCILIGATITLEFEAGAFPADSATVRIDPPGGDQILLNFDLTRLR
jgi:hypothetical protein